MRTRGYLCFIAAVAVLLGGTASAVLGEDLSDALVSLSAGTGFVVHSDGYILTNEHVVRDASSISVFLNDAQVEYEGTVIVTDAASDLALIKIGCTRLPAVVLGDSDDVSLFDPIVSLGYPSSLALGTDLTTSTGQVTAVRTNMEGREGKETFQTDGAIYHGSSGGPLLNMSGEVIGVNYAGIEGAEFYFAIPIRDASQIFHSIPDFDPWPESHAAETLSAQAVVNSVKPCIAYIQVEIERPLTDLLPEEALGSALESWTAYVSGQVGSLLLPIAPPSLPYSYDPRFGVHCYSVNQVRVMLANEAIDVECLVDRSNQALLGNIGRMISVAAFDLGTEAAAEAGRRCLLQSVASLPNLLLSDSRLLAFGPLNFAVSWSFRANKSWAVRYTLQDVEISSSIQGIGVYTIGSLLFSVWLQECHFVEDEVAMESGALWFLGGDSVSIQNGRVVSSTTIISPTGNDRQYQYQSAWSVDEFVDDFIEILNTSIAALSE